MKTYESIIMASCLLTLFSGAQVFSSGEDIYGFSSEIGDNRTAPCYWPNFLGGFSGKFRIGGYSLDSEGVRLSPLCFPGKANPLLNMKKMLLHYCGNSISRELDQVFRTVDRCNPFSENFLKQVAAVCNKNIIFLEVGDGVKFKPDFFEKLTIVREGSSQAYVCWVFDRSITDILRFNRDFIQLFQQRDETMMFVYRKGFEKMFHCALYETDPVLRHKQITREKVLRLIRNPEATGRELVNILTGIPSERCLAILKTTNNNLGPANNNCDTLLHMIAKHRNGVQFMGALVDAHILTPIQLADFLELKGQSGNTLFHDMVKYGIIEFILIVIEIIGKQQPNKLMYLLELKDKESNTPLHIMAKREEGAGILRALVEVVGLERLIHLLHMLNRHNENPLHFAAGYGHQGCVFLDVVIKNYLPQLIDLLEIKNNIGNTPLHVAAQLRNDEFIIAAGRAVDAVVGENQFIQFVSLTNNAGQTLAQIFVESQERVALATGRIP